MTPLAAPAAQVELPLALPVLLAGVRTSVVINIGTAAIASTVGAKTLGSPIIVGLTGFNTAYVIQGALLVAVLAVVTDMAFDRLRAAAPALAHAALSRHHAQRSTRRGVAWVAAMWPTAAAWAKPWRRMIASTSSSAAGAHDTSSPPLVCGSPSRAWCSAAKDSAHRTAFNRQADRDAQLLLQDRRRPL